MEAIEKTALNKVAHFIEPYVGNLFPGCIVGCADADRQFVYAIGTQDGVVKMEKSNIFDIAAVTQPILNVLTLKKIPFEELDQRITDTFSLKGKYRDQITVRHLLIFGVEYADKYPLSQIISRGELIYRLENGDLADLPGNKYCHTNTSSMILSRFLEKKFNKNLAELMKGGILLALGMNSTGFEPENFDPQLLSIVPTEDTEKLKRGIVQDESSRLYGDPIGSAGLFSAVGDLLKFGQSFLGENTYLPKEVIKAMPISQFENGAETYGLGMGLHHPSECDLLNEDGSPMVVLKKNGFSGVHLCIFPENDFVFVVFGNICFPNRPSQNKRDQFTRFHKDLLHLVYENKNELLK